MRNKRFGMFGVAREINVSSSSNYTVDVWFWETVTGGGAERKSYWYDPMAFGLISKSKNHYGREVPKYVIEALDAELRRLWNAGELRFFEYDHDGCKRYEDLRYHEPEWFKRSIGIKDGTP